MSARHGKTLTSIPVSAVGLVLAIPHGMANADPVALTGGKSARFRAFVVPARNNAVITLSDDALQPVLDPIACPADPTLRIRASDGFDSGVIVLPCASWRRAGTGFKYADRLAALSGVHSVVYSKRRLVIKLKGASYPALVGPLGFPPGIEVGFSSGTRDYCARFETFKRNDDGAATWLRLFDFTGAGVFGNAASGLWGPDRVVLARGAIGAGGVAPLQLVGTTHLGANLLDLAQQLGTQGTICVRIEQDPLVTGWIDCDGGCDPDVALAVDSNGPAAADPSILSVPGGADPLAAAGSGVVRVQLRFAVAPANDAACSTVDYAASPIVRARPSSACASSACG